MSGCGKTSRAPKCGARAKPGASGPGFSCRSDAGRAPRGARAPRLLTGGIAHDFNNLLAAILGSLEIVRRRVTDESVARLIDNAIRGAQRGAALTQRMLVFARRHELNVRAVDIPMLLRGMTEMLERSLGPSVIIETRFPLSLSEVKTDPNQLEMALLNLMVNARDAMPKGGPIVVAARSETVTPEHALLRPDRMCVCR
jgi:signal transduction histidine kinase